MLIIYSTSSCAWCVQVAKYLTNKKVKFQKIFIDDNIELRQKLLEKTGLTSVPVTTNGVQYVVGWNVAGLNNLIATQK
jgi:glutaredoxin